MPRGGKREGAGRPAGAMTIRTRKVVEQALVEGKTPLEIMLDNMAHFQKVALDAEATLEGLTASEFSTQMPSDASPDEQFKFLLLQVKKTVGLRQLAQDAARDAAPYIHPKLASVEHSGEIDSHTTHHLQEPIRPFDEFLDHALGSGTTSVPRGTRPN